MSLRNLFAAAGVLAGPALALGGASASCPLDGPLSCQNTTAVEDTCCFNAPGGQVLLTQFWADEGPADSFTIHGLWPDNCDGTWEEFCAPEREYFNITQVLEAGAPCTLKYMEDFWKDNRGDDESFWQHEFNKHGTCMSTLEPECYEGFKPGDEVVDYFKKTVKLHKALPSYKWLEEAGIVPSNTKTYTRAEMQAALRKHHGQDVIINCSGGNILNELWYHYNVQGSIQSGNFVPAVPFGTPSCPSTGIRYPPKPGATDPDTPTAPSSSSTSAGGPSPTPTGAPGVLSGKGRFYVSTAGQSNGGFLISGGTWYRGGGTPATYTATPNADNSAFTLTTSKGKCTIDSDELVCAASVTMPSLFGYDGSYLTFDGSSTFYATALPSGNTQGAVYTTPKAVSFQASWVAA